MKNNKKFIQLTVFFAIIIVIFVSWVTTNIIKKQVEEDTHQYLSTILESTHQNLNTWAENHKSNIETWAKEILPATKELLKHPTIQDSLINSRIQYKIREKLRPLYSINDYEGFFIISPENINLASSRNSNVGKINLLFDHEDFLEKLWSGETVLTTPLTSDVPLLDKKGNLQENRATMFIGTPIKNKSGNIIALFTLRINPSKDFNTIFERGRFGKSGETYGVDKYGRMISFSRFPSELEKLGVIKPGENEILQIKITNPGVNLTKGEKRTILTDSLPLTLMAKNLVKYNSGSNLNGYRDYRGVPVIGVWSWNKEFDFGTATEIDVKEAYKSFYFIRFTLISLTLFIIGLLIGLSYLYTWLNKRILTSEEQFKSLFENSPLGIYQTKPDGTIMKANSALLKMLEYDSLEQLQKRDLSEEGYSKESSINRGQFIEMIDREGFVKGLEESWTTSTGKIIPIRENARVVRNSKGEILFYEGTVEDITERKLAEKKLHDLNKRNELILNSIGEGIYGLDLEGKITFINPEAATMLGSSVEELIGIQAHANHHHTKPDGSFYSPETCPIYATFATGIQNKVDTEVFWRKDGTSFPVYYISTPIKNSKGKLIGSVVVFKDTTERKKVEKELKDSEERFRTIIETSPVPFTIAKTSDGTLLMANESLSKLFDIPIKDIIGKKTPDFYYDLNDRNILLKAFFKNGFLNDYEIKLKKLDGTPIWCSVSLKLMTLGNEKVILTGFYDITERKHSEKKIKDLNENLEKLVNIRTSELENTKKRLEFLLTSAPVVIYTSTFTAPFGITYIGDNIKQMTGYKAKKFIEDRDFWASKVHPDDLDFVFSELTKTVDKGYNRIEYRILLNDGTYKFIQNELIIVKDRNDTPIELLGYWIDITERKKFEESLALSEARFRDITLSTSDLVWEVDAHGKFIYCSNNVIDLFGYSIDEMFEKNIFDIIQPEEVEFTAAIFSEILQHKKPLVDFENICIKKDGTFFNALVNGIPVLDKVGNILGFRGSIKDITERKTYEKELQDTLKEISDYKYAMDESSIIVITDQKGIINHVNDNFCAISKFSRDEVIGQDHRIINSSFHSKDFFHDLWTTIANGKIWNGEIRNKAKDGSFYWVDTVIVPFLNKNGKPYQYVTIRRDITEQKKLRDDLVEAKESADIANRAKSEFLANMSHEIRTPMNAVIGFSELLYNTIENEKQRSQIKSIYNSGKNLLKIISDILDLSKIEAGKLTIEKGHVNIHKLSKELKFIFTHETEKKGILFHIETESHIPTSLLLDETRLRQILFNLLGNAIKFTEKGHVILTLDKKGRTDNKIDLIIKVEDTGIGIPKDQQEKIFEAFGQQDDQINSKYGGTGLGLSITKRLVEMMGGEISVNSKPNKGSIFTIFIPNIEITTDESIIESEILFNPTSIIFKDAKVLIVDDNKENRNLIKDMFKNSPTLTLYEAENGEEAIEIATKKIPDLILMDIRMPLMNGYKACQILKTQESTKSIPVIAISASSKIILKDSNIKENFDSFIMKPIDLNELVQLLKKYLKYKNAKKKAESKINMKLNAEQKKELPKLIHILENEFMPEYTKVRKTQSINDIEKFGNDLVFLGKNNNAKIIFEYGTKVCTLVDHFEIDTLITVLNSFPKIIEQYKSFFNTN